MAGLSDQRRLFLQRGRVLIELIFNEQHGKAIWFFRVVFNSYEMVCRDSIKAFSYMGLFLIQCRLIHLFCHFIILAKLLNIKNPSIIMYGRIFYIMIFYCFFNIFPEVFYLA